MDKPISEILRNTGGQNSAPVNSPKVYLSDEAALRREFPRRHVVNRKAVSFEPAFSSTLEKIVTRQSEKHGSLVVLLGIPGTGKTQLATLAAFRFGWDGWKNNQYCEKRVPMYTKAADIFMKVRCSFRHNSEYSEEDVFLNHVLPHLLIIDELQERGDTAAEDRTLARIIDKRYDKMLHTVLISNLTRSAMSESIGERVISRLHESGETIDCNWPSFRKQVKA